jgi:hypothetical protein
MFELYSANVMIAQHLHCLLPKRILWPFRNTILGSMGQTQSSNTTKRQLFSAKRATTNKAFTIVFSVYLILQDPICSYCQ